MARLLRRAAAAFGRPRYVITDLGGEFVGKAFRRAVARLAAVQRFASRENLYATARLERFWRTLKDAASLRLRRPLGVQSLSNWQRFENAEVDAALTAFEATNDPEEQRQLSDTLQGLFSEYAPMIPLYPSPSWGIANTKRFRGFPNAQDPYARLSPFSPPEYLLVLLNLEATE